MRTVRWWTPVKSLRVVVGHNLVHFLWHHFSPLTWTELKAMSDWQKLAAKEGPLSIVSVGKVTLEM